MYLNEKQKNITKLQICSGFRLSVNTRATNRGRRYTGYTACTLYYE
jgi:hypothetical protein